ncbi:hypothetical protein CDAR_530481 [Caerostris darwini]|uniref:Uncharacterized protein n=1 Tax=Caerostris darwini TaxID=1538125 RepID=A0AAV4PMA9_9ARAC|nr:hypothetical protein CDAR_530481 [Caerostris darwini]
MSFPSGEARGNSTFNNNQKKRFQVSRKDPIWSEVIFPSPFFICKRFTETHTANAIIFQLRADKNPLLRSFAFCISTFFYRFLCEVWVTDPLLSSYQKLKIQGGMFHFNRIFMDAFV